MEARFKAFDEQVRTQQQQVEDARAERERLMNELPKATSALYKRIAARIRDGVAMAEARNGACTACYMALRPQIMSEVRRGQEVITCDNCNRILYYAPATEAQPATVS
jgi:predicted  nucleic acid-binding Zn-ribbon protein